MNQRVMVGTPPFHSFYQSLISALARSQHNLCYHCSLPIELEDFTNFEMPHVATKDHLHPKSQRGSDDPSNLVAACRRCNKLRADMDAIVFRSTVQCIFRKWPGVRDQWHEEDFLETPLGIKICTGLRRVYTVHKKRYSPSRIRP